MNFRLVLSVLLFALILVGGTALYNHNNDFCEDLIAQLSECVEKVEAKENPHEIFFDAKSQWDEKVKIIQMYIMHNRIEGISAAFARASSQIDHSTEDFLVSLHELILLLKNMSQYDKPTVQGVL